MQQVSSRTHIAAPGPYRLVAATSFGVLLSAMDSSIVNVSLATMEVSFGVGLLEIQWVVLAYLLILTSSMPLTGKFGDRFGKKRVFQAGMAVFVGGSLACALSPSLVVLVTCRGLQAVGASMMAANGLAIVTYFTTNENRGRAIGMNSVVLAAALGLGPVIGGILSQNFGWPSIFLINLPLGAIGFLVVARVIPETERVHEVRFDSVGAVLFFLALLIFIHAISVSSSVSVIQSLIHLAAGLTVSVVFILRERGFSSPIIPVSVLVDRRISTGIVSSILSYMALVPVSLLIPLWLQEAMDLTQSQTGLFLTVHPITISVTGPLAGLLSERIDTRIQSGLGLGLEIVGLVIIALAVPNLPLMVAGVIVMGTGLSVFSVSNGNSLMTSAPRNYMGVVSALTNISRTAGFSAGTAMTSAVFTMYFLGLSQSLQFFEAYGTGLSWTILTFCILVAVAIVISSLRGLNPAEIERRRPQSDSSRTGEA
ncbi:MAG: MFS transporter [Candidatus Thorarchaeota archaeon]|nr:MFS transporter [Candidatus Thorarchaeota archaeon]